MQPEIVQVMIDCKGAMLQIASTEDAGGSKGNYDSSKGQLSRDRGFFDDDDY